MATLTHSYRPHALQIAFVRKRDDLIEKLLPRRCMVVSAGLFLIGLGIPMLMAVQMLPVTLLLSLIGLALTASGIVLTLIFCGEI